MDAAEHPTPLAGRSGANGRDAWPRLRRRRLPSIHTLLFCLTVLPPLLTGTVLLVLADRSLERVSEEMARAQADEITAFTEAECRRYFERAVRLSNIMTDIVRIGEVSVSDMEAWRPRLFANMRAVPEVSTIIYISPEGNGTFVSGSPDGLAYGIGTAKGVGMLDVVSYPATLDGAIDRTRPRRFDYDLNVRPWHQLANRTDGPAWTEPYEGFGTLAFGGRGGLGVAYARRIFSDDGKPLGELAIVQRFSAVNAFLVRRAQAHGGYLLLYTDDGLILGNSLPHRENEVAPPIGGREDPQRLPELADDPHAIERALLPLLRDRGGERLQGAGRLAEVTADGRTYRVRETSVRVRAGSAWRLVVALPEPALLGGARATQRGMLAAGAVLVGLSAVAGALVATRLSRPLAWLSRFAAGVGAGGFEGRTAGRVETARELAELGAALDRMAANLRERVNLLAQRDAAEQAAAVKSRLIAHVSHEFRTPLNAIIGYGEMLRDAAADRPRDRQDASNILLASKHLLGLINNLLDLSRAEAGRLRIDEIDFDVRTLVDEVVATIRPVFEARHNRLEIEAAGDLGRMHSDPSRIKQILINLLSNAAKFTNGGEVRLVARRDVSAEGAVVFQVIDTGIGMTDEQLQHVFEPFFQVHHAGTNTGEGAGLGLAIARQLADLLHGEISIESRAGAGTTVSLVFAPRLPAPGTAQIGPGAPAAHPAPQRSN